MRLWSLHPKYLDKSWILALWREWLLAKKVLEGTTKWYRNHPQLIRFKNYHSPVELINIYLTQILLEAQKRWYKFWEDKIIKNFQTGLINVNIWQIKYENTHLLKKLKNRDFEKFKTLSLIKKIEVNPIFKVIPWDIEAWEKINSWKYLNLEI